MARYIFGQFYGLPIQKTIALMIIISVIWYYCDKCVIGKKCKKIMWKDVNRCLVIGMILIIFVLTISSRNADVTEVQWTPFHSFVEAKIQPEIYRSMLMNVFLFFPLGLTMPHALPEKWKHNALLTIIFACVLSIVIEYLQYHFHLGRAETDDVICNTLGCFIGTISYMLSKKMVGKKSQDRS